MNPASSNIKETIVRAPFTPEISGREAFVETEALVRRIPDFGAWVSEPITKRASLGFHDDNVYEVTTHRPTVTFREDEASILTLTREPLPRGQTKDLPPLEWVDPSEGWGDAKKIQPSNPEKRPHLRVLSFSLGGEKKHKEMKTEKDIYRWNKKPISPPTQEKKNTWEQHQDEKNQMRKKDATKTSAKESKFHYLPQHGNVHQPWEPLKEERAVYGPQTQRPQKKEANILGRQPTPDLAFSEEDFEPLPQGREPRNYWPNHEAKNPRKDRESAKDWSNEDKNFMRNVALHKQLGEPILGDRNAPKQDLRSTPTTPVPAYVPPPRPPMPTSVISVPNLGPKLVLVQRKKKERRTWKQRSRNQKKVGPKSVPSPTPVPTTPKPLEPSTDAPKSPFDLEQVFGTQEKSVNGLAGEGEKRKRNISGHVKPKRRRGNNAASRPRSVVGNKLPEIPILKHVGNVEQDGARRFNYE